jgi:hypothetical protein
MAKRGRPIKHDNESLLLVVCRAVIDSHLEVRTRGKKRGEIKEIMASEPGRGNGRSQKWARLKEARERKLRTIALRLGDEDFALLLKSCLS